MATYLDVSSWARREAFEFFRGFDKPYFNVCTRLDVSRLAEHARQVGAKLSLAYHYAALRLANEVEPFRYRLEGSRVRVHEVIHGGTTVLRGDESFAFAFFEYDAQFATFARGAAGAIARVKSGEFPWNPREGDDGLVYFTTLPWIAFTSFSHARNWGREDSVPRIAFGRLTAEGDRRWLPISIEVHHALMDGFHVGRFVNRFEEVLADPAGWLLGD
jgi:chloramphenicol O-acetyltransferase type A